MNGERRKIGHKEGRNGKQKDLVVNFWRSSAIFVLKKKLKPIPRYDRPKLYYRTTVLGACVLSLFRLGDLAPTTRKGAVCSNKKNKKSFARWKFRTSQRRNDEPVPLQADSFFPGRITQKPKPRSTQRRLNGPSYTLNGFSWLHRICLLHQCFCRHFRLIYALRGWSDFISICKNWERDLQ